MKHKQFICAVMAALLLCSCSQKADMTGVQHLLDVFSLIYTPLDEMNTTYADALAIVADYVADPSEDSRQTASNAVYDAYMTIGALSFTDYAADTAAEEFIKERLLSLEDFAALWTIAATTYDTDLAELELLYYYLENVIPTADAVPAEFTEEVNYVYQTELLMQEHYYYATNQFFLPLEKAELEYAKTYLTDHFSTMARPDYVWQDTVDDAVAMQDACWEEILAIPVP